MVTKSTRTKVSPKLTRVWKQKRHVLVIVDRLHRGPTSVACRDIDEGLEVVAKELDHAPTGTTLTLLQSDKDVMRTVAHWKVHPSGARRYKVNPDGDEAEILKVLPGPPDTSFYILRVTLDNGSAYKATAVCHRLRGQFVDVPPESHYWVDLFELKKEGNLRATGVSTQLGGRVAQLVKPVVLEHAVTLIDLPQKRGNPPPAFIANRRPALWSVEWSDGKTVLGIAVAAKTESEAAKKGFTCLRRDFPRESIKMSEITVDCVSDNCL